MTTFSSIELAFKLYVPGKSRILALALLVQNPIFFNRNSGIIPHLLIQSCQLIKTEVLPVLGFPIKATLMF
jgi:hypothetical protein